MTPMREVATAALAARLTAQLSGVTVERTRRAPVNVDDETLPRVLLTVTEWEADETAEPLIVHYTCGFVVQGWATGATELAADQATIALHAQIVAALAGWTPATAGLGEPSEIGGETRLLDAEDSAKCAGECAARFTMLVLAPLGSPYAT